MDLKNYDWHLILVSELCVIVHVYDSMILDSMIIALDYVFLDSMIMFLVFKII